MIDRIFFPTPVLSDVVDFYLYYTIDPDQPSIQHYATPVMQGLVFNFRKQPQYHSYNGKTFTSRAQAYLFGQCTCPRVVSEDENGAEVLGIKFKPLGISKITGINMEHMANQIVAAEDIWGNEFELLCDEMLSAPSLEKMIAILEKFLIGKFIHTTLYHRVNNAQNALSLITSKNGNISVKSLQEQTNTSRKTLERSFMHYVGIHPKLYTRIVRFNVLKEYMDRNFLDENLTSLALKFGFYDSSHFIAEFKNFSGTTPTEYLKSKKKLYFSMLV